MTIAVLDNQAVACEYIKQGFTVLPLCWPGSDRSCGCGRHHQEKAIGKAPLTDHGLKDATQTILGVKEYWNRWPQANIGIAIPTGYFVLDVDIEHSGFESLELLQDKVGILPDTWRITTGSGGVHLWYKTNIPIRNTVSLGGFPGIDVRGEGGYVVAPPSLHRSGQRYEVAEDYPISEASEPLIELCAHRQIAQGSTLSTEQSILEGQRNQTLTSLAGSMRRRGMSHTAIEAALKVENNERCQPPLSDEEIIKIAKSVATYSPESNGLLINNIINNKAERVALYGNSFAGGQVSGQVVDKLEASERSYGDLSLPFDQYLSENPEPHYKREWQKLLEPPIRTRPL